MVSAGLCARRNNERSLTEKLACAADMRRVYEPAQYSKDTPANLLVCFDGGGAVIQHSEKGPTGGEPVLLDNLHASNAIPVTIVVGITPGRTPDYPEQRSLEYDTVRTVSESAQHSYDTTLS